MLTVNAGVGRNVIVVHRTRWTTFANVFEILDQILLASRLEEQVGQTEASIDPNFLAMFGQFVYFGNATAADLYHANHAVFATAFQPLFGATLAFVDSQASPLARCPVHQDAVHTFRFQIVAVLVNVVVDNGFPALREKKTRQFNANICLNGQTPKSTHLSTLKAVNTGHIMPLK